jgi:hypothetical protein
MGEASESQLRIWSRGLASVVTRTGWYAELPPDTAWFVDPASEVADLHAHFASALAHPQALQGLGAAGRQVLGERHDPARYAAELVAGVERMMRTPASVVGQAAAAIASIADASGINAPARGAIARRTAEELSRWISPAGQR